MVFTHEWPAVVCLIEAIKRRHPDVPVILGGEHISSMPEFCLLTSVADVLVLGEGEETVIELLHALRDKQPLDEIEGIAYRSGDDVVVNPRRQRATEIDDITWPAWHLFALGHLSRAPVDGRHVLVHQVGAHPRHAWLPLPVHVLLGTEHVDAEVDPPRSGQGRRRDPVLRRALRRSELSLPGPHSHHPTRVDRRLL